MLRTYSAAADGVTVTSVDDNPEWLERTRRFIEANGYDTDGLTLWDDYLTAPTGPHDVVLHDFASGELRNESMRVAAANLASGGHILFDDAQHGGHQQAMWDTADEYALHPVDISRWTMDRIGRYSQMWRKL